MKCLLKLACIGVLGTWGCSSDTATPPGMPIEPGQMPGSGVMMPTSVTGMPGAAGSGAVAPTPSGPSMRPATSATPSGMPPASAGSGMMPPTSGMMPSSMPLDTSCPTCNIAPECRGFSFEGIKYSPGGSVLPDKCKPFDATTNNPYAVRCVDALPGFKTQFAGDEYCVLPPPPEKGFQVGLHPQGNSATYWKAIWAGDYSGYQNPTAEWQLKSGDEKTQNYRTSDAPLPMPMNYYRTYFRMRTGSHHMIVTMHESTEADGWIPGTGEALPGFFDPGSGLVNGILGGEQRPDDNTPASLEKPVEDDGLYLTFPANPSIIFNMHHFNASDKPLLREGWINIWKEEDARQRVSWYMGLEFGQVIDLSVAPGQSRDFHYSWRVGSDMRLIRIFGHRHFWTTNFSAWIERADGKIELAYQSYDWFDMPTYRYDSVAKNPPPDPTKAMDGALSGVMNLKAGDELHFNCHVEFTEQRAATDKNAPKPREIGTLRFANEAYNGEMCIQFGNVTGGLLGLPGVDTSPLPDFAKVTRQAAPAP